MHIQAAHEDYIEIVKLSIELLLMLLQCTDNGHFLMNLNYIKSIYLLLPCLRNLRSKYDDRQYL